METETSQKTKQAAPVVGPGRMLYGAREQRGMSVDDVAKALNLSPRHIEALEADDFETLAGPTYIRGYLRGYALFLALDPESVIQRYNELHAASEETHDLGVLTPPPQASSNDRLVKLGTVIVAGLVFGLAVIWWVGRDETRTLPTAAVTTTDTPPVGMPQPGLEPVNPESAAINEASKESADSEMNAQTPAQERVDQVAAIPPPAAPAPVQPKPSLATSDTAIDEKSRTLQPANPAVRSSTPRTSANMSTTLSPANSAERAKVVIHTTQESWIDIRDARQSRLLYETLAAGRTVAVEGVAPLNVFIGNAEGVRVEFNGSPYDVTPYRRGQVARFSVPPANAGSNSGLLGP